MQLVECHFRSAFLLQRAILRWQNESVEERAAIVQSMEEKLESAVGASDLTQFSLGGEKHFSPTAMF